MSAVPVFHAYLPDDGGLELDVREAADRRRWIASLKARGVHECDLILRPHKSQRSLDQNAYWWAVPVALVADHTGYTPEQAHYWLLGEYGGYERGPTGHDIPRIAASSKLTTDEFTKLIEWALEWGPSTLGVYIPAPGEAEAA